MSWTVVLDKRDEEKALALCRGQYQRDIILGKESLSGSTLKGRAKQYSGRYAQSRQSLISRLNSAGIYWTEVEGRNGKRILVIGAR